MFLWLIRSGFIALAPFENSETALLFLLLEYLVEDTAMNLADAKLIYQEIQATKYTSLADDLAKAAVRYAGIRADWQLAPVKQRREMDDLRSRAHNVLIDSCNILSRNMAKAGEDTAWRDKIGNDRKSIGDFACYLHCIIGIMAR